MKRALLLVLALMVIGISVTSFFLWGMDMQKRFQILHNISVGFNVIYALTIITVVITIIKDNNDPIITISWIQTITSRTNYRGMPTLLALYFVWLWLYWHILFLFCI